MSLLLPPPRCSWSFPIVPAQCQHSGQSTSPNNPQNAENDGIKKEAKNNEMSATAIEVPIKEGKLTFLCTENGPEAEEGSELFKIDLLKMKQEEQQGSPEKGGESLNGQERGGGEDAQNNGNQMMDQTEIYRELILRHLIADISGTCTKLGLPTELAAWTVDGELEGWKEGRRHDASFPFGRLPTMGGRNVCAVPVECSPIGRIPQFGWAKNVGPGSG
jgi:hypothetical protein